MDIKLQPERCRLPLPAKELDYEVLPHFQRVMFFDPAPVYDRMAAAGHGDPFRRVNSLNMNILFPTEAKGVCACGCGEKLTGRRSRWAKDDCSKFALGVYCILVGSLQRYEQYVYHYWGHGCKSCGDTLADFQIDHIIPVWAGGGLCWLSNFQILCIPCHKEKTKADRAIY